MNCPIPQKYRVPLAMLLVVLFVLALASLGVVDQQSVAWLGAGGLVIGNTQMTPSQARVIDPILTEVARGYKNADFIGEALFPVVPVGQRGGKVIQFGKEDFKLYATARAPGGNTKRINYGYAGANYSLTQHALEGQVPVELMDEASAVPGIDLSKVAVTKTQNIIALRLEKERSDLATDGANYAASNKLALSGTDMWSDLEASNPIAHVEAAKEAVRAKTGRRPNTLVMGAAVMASLRQHTKILDRIKYTGRDVPTPELLASLFGVQRVLVGDAVYADAAGDFTDVWGNNVVVAYTEFSGLSDMGMPSYGYTYQLRNYPLVEQAYFERNPGSWFYPVKDECSPVIAGADAGFLISNVV